MPYDFHQIASKVSNWGRWGADDQRGCLNLVTPDVLRRAAASVRQGKLIRVGVDFGREWAAGSAAADASIRNST